MSEETVSITAQVTPNPNTLKFLLDHTIMDKGTIDFLSAEQAESSPLPLALFAIDGVAGVMVGTNFVSVTKSVNIDWTGLAEPVTATIRKVVTDSEQLIDLDLVTAEHEDSEDSETVKKIKEILDQEIRPAVAMDGGDIIFQGYDEGVVRLYLQGACQSCPSATLTLKMGIENRLKEDIPEITEVIQVN